MYNFLSKYHCLNTGLVETKYFDLGFLKQPNSNNLHEKLVQSLSTIDLGKMIQVFMDAPNFNWNVHKVDSKYREENELSELVSQISSS